MPMPSVDPMPPLLSELRPFPPLDEHEASYFAASARMASLSDRFMGKTMVPNRRRCRVKTPLRIMRNLPPEPLMDLVIRHATLPDGRTDVDIGIEDGRFAAIQSNLPAQGAKEIDATGRLVSPPFVDAHFHMDATLSLGLPRLNESGTLLEGIALWGELKPMLTPEAVIERALRYCDLAVSQGLLAVRSHVDVCDDRLLAVEALLEVKRLVKPYLDLQLVAFPQDGYFRSSTAARNLERALDLGVDVVGGIPHFERTMEEGAASVKALCAIAAKRGLMIDLHCDESDDPLSRHIE